MSIDIIIWFMTIYVAAEYVLARSTVSLIEKIDPDYFALDENHPDRNIHRKSGVSSRIVEMLFDSDLPASDFGGALEVLIYAVRTMYVLTIPLAVVLFII